MSMRVVKTLQPAMTTTTMVMTKKKKRMAAVAAMAAMEVLCMVIVLNSWIKQLESNVRN